jgi:hypothetical protein
MAACVLLVLLIFGVGSVMAFVLGRATPIALLVGAALLVMSWHGLRRIDPSGSGERPPENWGTAVFVAVVVAAIMIAALVWTPWLTIFAAIISRSGFDWRTARIGPRRADLVIGCSRGLPRRPRLAQD